MGSSALYAKRVSPRESETTMLPQRPLRTRLESSALMSLTSWDVLRGDVHFGGGRVATFDRERRRRRSLVAPRAGDLPGFSGEASTLETTGALLSPCASSPGTSSAIMTTAPTTLRAVQTEQMNEFDRIDSRRATRVPRVGNNRTGSGDSGKHTRLCAVVSYARSATAFHTEQDRPPLPRAALG